jgi:hypothetical protein
MDDRKPDDTLDEDLRRVLERWPAGSPGIRLEARLRETFRTHTARRSQWRRFMSSSVRVPAPALAALVLLGAILLGLALHRPASPSGTAGVPSPLPDPAGTSSARASLAGFEPVREPRIIVLEGGARP